uniref:Uncharacterized protein LOC114338656 isoform X1 n=1 Tax=Diabrotica virgifera virgifera TaxID=50390 RepID=A0A6P7GMN2_DIAVI
MAAFQIHEDIENIGARTKKILGMKIPIRKEVGNNYQRIPVKQYFTKKHEENKVQKKSFFNNRVPLQPPKAQNILLDVSLEKNKEEEDIDGSFLIIEKENKIETVKEEKDPFPVSLLHNNEYREVSDREINFNSKNWFCLHIHSHFCRRLSCLILKLNRFKKVCLY